ncbi:MAG: ABC transporter ATP-binding protein [Desulfovibrionaceae bacterium]|jgi:ABC-2 type transport system ATP-binding protein|nr:ABC transporter ATP-binding protein [Desulfovibrionaceae bacterium]
MIRIEALTKRYKNKTALGGINLRVEPGELFAYLGPNGAGKTTTIRILTGLTRMTSGAAFVAGHDITVEPVEAKRACGVVSQAMNLDHELSVRENLDVHARLFGLESPARGRRIDELLEYIELADRAKMAVRGLSGGLKRRLMIARALIHSPRVLFLDEPTVGLDAEIRRRTWALIKQVQLDGTTVFLTTHYIEEAEFLADRVVFLDEGAIVAQDTPAALMNALGEWSLDSVRNGHIDTLHFRTREEAAAHAARHDGSFTLRRVNLEDCFLHMTGKKIAPRAN